MGIINDNTTDMHTDTHLNYPYGRYDSSVSGIKCAFNALKEDVYQCTQNKTKPDKLESAIGFFSNAKYAVKLAFAEKEIFFFAFLQVIVIALGYILWTQMLDWIPPEIWRDVQECSDRDGKNCSSIVDLVLL